MKIIQLTQHGNTPVWINGHHILAITPASDGGSIIHTLKSFDNFRVLERPQAIMAMLRAE